MNHDTYERTLALIYDTAIAPQRWPDLLAAMSKIFSCHFVGMVATSPERDLHQGMAHGVDRATHQDFLRRFHRTNPVATRAPPQFAGQIIDAAAVIPRAVLERTEMFQAFFRPLDIGAGARLTVLRDTHGAQSLSLMRSWSAGAFDADELAAARALMPHLRRMAMIGRRIRSADLMVSATQAAMNAVQQPLLLLDAGLNLLHANAAAENLLRMADGLSVQHSFLVAATAAATRRLSTLLAKAAAFTRLDTQSGGGAGSIRLPRPSGQAPLAAVIIPVGGLRDVMVGPNPAILVCVADPVLHGGPPPALLHDLFGLTPAEAALASQLLAGKDIGAIAKESDRSINTVRNQLARLMAKTDTNRQGELIRLLGQLPRGQNPHE